jgi:protein TonB
MNARPKPSESILGHCLVEGDEVALALAQRTRRKAVVVSLLLEGACLGGLLLFPLLATGQRPILHQVMPLPPYGGGPRTNPQTTRGSKPVSRRSPKPGKVIFQPPRIPNSVVIGREPTEGGEPRESGPGINLSGIEGGARIPGVVPPPWAFTGSKPVEPPAEHKPIRRSEGVQQALLLHRVVPVYPPLARQINLEGAVRLRAVIGGDGSVRSLEVLSGHPLLAQAAREAVTQWRYRPTLLNGQPVEVETYVTVVFELRR